ncbi:MAG: isoprenylcysteine carboxylmethyltransferase family protein [Herpetosiphon sp.]|nr:isoprenylcysteine carboxylmethyltransferase family protein [Herpetosiphon sp.]
MLMKSLTFVIIQFVCLGIIAFTAPFVPQQWWLLALEVLGVLIGIWGVWSMRVSKVNVLPDVRPDAQLVTHGIYRWIRHPMYSGLLLMSLALVIAYFTWWRLLVWLILLVNLWLKASYEESLLVRHFPDYAAYKQRTKRLIPWVV